LEGLFTLAVFRSSGFKMYSFSAGFRVEAK
jgi:hypothetical protein